MSGPTLRALIVDDESLAVERLAHLCARLEGLDVVGVAEDGRTALSRIEDLEPDLLLLDISMPGMDGMALARALGGCQKRPAIVFVTAHSIHAVAAFELAATDYLLKPVSLDRLRQAVARVAAAVPPAQAGYAFLTEIWAPRGREMVRVDVATLDLLEAERDYVRLHARGQSYLLRATLQAFEQRLDPEHFVRVHRSAIVRAARISALQRRPTGGWIALLSNGSRVRIGRAFQSSVRKFTNGPV